MLFFCYMYSEQSCLTTHWLSQTCKTGFLDRPALSQQHSFGAALSGAQRPLSSFVSFGVLREPTAGHRARCLALLAAAGGHVADAFPASVQRPPALPGAQRLAAVL